MAAATSTRDDEDHSVSVNVTFLPARAAGVVCEPQMQAGKLSLCRRTLNSKHSLLPLAISFPSHPPQQHVVFLKKQLNLRKLGSN